MEQGVNGLENKRLSGFKDSVDYYNENAAAFIDASISADVSELYEPFERRLSLGCKILDLGCGSGRDSRYFVGKGYDVIAIDPSEAMCKQTKSIAQIPVFQMRAEELQFNDEFDGVWACASLLHVPKDTQLDTLRRIGNALKRGGICYCSWKYGNSERSVEGRHFTDFTVETFRDLLKKATMFEEVEVWTTHDVRKDRQDQKWLNALMRKK